MSDMKRDISGIKQEIFDMKQDIETLQGIAVKIETDLKPKIRILLELNSDLINNVNAAKNVAERVNMLKFEMKIVKETIDAIRHQIA